MVLCGTLSPVKEPLSGLKHPAIKDALALAEPAGRRAQGRYLVEGMALVRQALVAPEATVVAVFALDSAAPAVEAGCAAKNATLYLVGPGLLQKLVGTSYTTRVTTVAVVAQRPVAPQTLLAADAVILCGEAIQDPRNVGVLVRTADALGCAGLLLSADSADPYKRDAVRSTTGSILRLPLALAPDLPAALAALHERGARIVASSGTAPVLARDAALSSRRPLVLVVGNEQEGISTGVAEVSDTVVRLPMAPQTGADSLNVTVAAGMLLYEAGRDAGYT
jgi:TrmH family RNA methyltransferase